MQIILCILFEECQVKFDHMGQVIEGNADCFNKPDQHFTECILPESKCMSSMTAEMTVNGSIHYDFARSCVRTEGIGNSCEIETSVPQKSCQVVCNGFNCNGDNYIEMLFADTNSLLVPREKSCYFYSSERDFDFDLALPGLGDLGSCPIFANQGCFLSQFFLPEQPQFHRGCSPFPFDDLTYNENYCTGNNCYRMCFNNGCNANETVTSTTSQMTLTDPVITTDDPLVTELLTTENPLTTEIVDQITEASTYSNLFSPILLILLIFLN